MDKEDVVYIYNGILLSHKKLWNLAICDDMNGSWGHFAKRDKSDRKREIPCSLNYMWKKIKNSEIQRTGWWLPEAMSGAWAKLMKVVQ